MRFEVVGIRARIPMADGPNRWPRQKANSSSTFCWMTCDLGVKAG
jgi:hypothetical protein